MKKLTSLVLATLLFLFAVTGCAANNPVSTNKPQQSSSAASADKTPAASSSPAVSEESTPSTPEESASATSADTGTAASPADFYQKYLDAKSTAFDKISKKLDEKPELSLSVAMTFIAVSTVDLSMIGLTLMSPDSAAGAGVLGMLGMKDAKVDVNGNQYTLTFTDNDGKQSKQTCEFDPATQSIVSELFDASGKESLLFECVKTADGYASQYYKTGEKNSIITCFVNSQTMSFGICDGTAAPASIFKNTAVTADFVKNNELYMTMEGDKLTIIEKGKETAF